MISQYSCDSEEASRKLAKLMQHTHLSGTAPAEKPRPEPSPGCPSGGCSTVNEERLRGFSATHRARSRSCTPAPHGKCLSKPNQSILFKLRPPSQLPAPGK